MSAIPAQVDPQAPSPVFPQQTTKVARRFTAREWRIAIILAMVALVSIADLYLTLTYLTHGGMAEGNPVARWVMSIGCPWILGVWKAALVGITCAILFAFRKKTSAEIAAWICCLVMGWLIFQWRTYIADIDRDFASYPQLTEVNTWVSFDND